MPKTQSKFKINSFDFITRLNVKCYLDSYFSISRFIQCLAAHSSGNHFEKMP